MVSFVRRCCILLCVIVFLVGGCILVAQENRVVYERGGSTIVLEPYAPNILRVTLSLNRAPALAPPGYGVLAAPAAAGWSASPTAQADVYQSARIIATVDRYQPSTRPPDPNQAALGKYFRGSAPGAHITLRTPDGKTLLEMTGWMQGEPNQKDGTAEVLHDRRSTDPRSIPWARHSPRPPTSTTTAWARTTKASSIIAAMWCAAGPTTLLPPLPASACPFW